MCTVMAMSIGMGAAQAVTGIAEQNRAHRAQVDAVNRSNAMARQKYLNDITISAFKINVKVRYLQLNYKLMLQLDLHTISKNK